MKKFYIVLLSICLITNSYANISQDDIREAIILEQKNLSPKKQETLAKIEQMIQSGKQQDLTQDQIKFYNQFDGIVRKRAGTIAAARIKEAMQKDKAKIFAFQSAPQGSRPDFKQNDPRIDIVQKFVALDKEIAHYNKNHRGLEAMLASDDDTEYQANSSATSPYNCIIPSIDGTMNSLTKAGKDIWSTDATSAENTFQIKMTLSPDKKDCYDITITGDLVHDQDGRKPAHSNLAQSLYKHINLNSTKEKHDSTIEGDIEGTRYAGQWCRWMPRVTSCADVEATITCPREVLVYLVKESSYDKSSADKQTKSAA
ncbi:MAG: hypothetical protein Q8Q60_03625 [Candidatus Chromulinivorax sp.]|nr:hypothetical protein [Candidatus Chromulinivorax sp.]